MAKVYVVSDPHFYHEKLIKHRGFKDVESYHNFYIKEWNSVVSKRDVVYILGDITMERNQYEILDRLQGIKHVILGNHDCHKRSHLESLMKHVNKIMSSEKIHVNEDFKVLLTHIPVHPIEFDYKVKLNIHGHLHEKLIEDERYINICPEHFSYRPLLLEDIITSRMKEINERIIKLKKEVFNNIRILKNEI